MNQLSIITGSQTHLLIAAADARGQTRFYEFFAANIRNKHTRRAYGQNPYS